MVTTKPNIHYLDYYVPQQQLPVDEFLLQLDKANVPPAFSSLGEYETFIRTILNLNALRVENELDTPEMMGQLIINMFSRHIIKPAEIDMIIVLGEQKDASVKNIGQFLQYKYAMNNARVINLSGNHCADLDIALGLAAAFCQGTVRNILILCATRSVTPAARIIGTYGLMSDAAGLVLVSNAMGIIQIGDQLVFCKGMLYEADMVKNNMLLHAKYIKKEVTGILNKNALHPQDIDAVLIQNANPVLFRHMLLEMEFKEHAAFQANIGRYGHLDTIDLIVNLKSILEEEQPQRRKNLLTIGFGWAGTYVTSILTVND